MKNPSLLLINPWIYDFALYDFWARPLGLLYLASLLRLNGYNVSYIDCLDRYYPGLEEEPGLTRGVTRQFGTGSFYRRRIPKPSCLRDIPRYFYRYGLSQRLFLEALGSVEKPAAVLVTSGMTYWYPGAFEVIRLAKERWPDVPVILGGIYATICHEHAKANSGADFIMDGPGENRILPLLEKITGEKTASSLEVADLDDLLCPTFDFCCPGDSHASLARHVVPDMVPYPAFDLQRRIDYVCLLTSRGCPFNCSYCASHLLQTKFLRRSPGNVVAEILFWHREHSVRDFAFYDDALLVDAESHIIPVLEAVIASGIEANFHSPNGLHARFINAKLAGLMHRAGFSAVRLGLETTSNRLDNKVTFEEFAQAVSYLKEAGFESDRIIAYLLMGLPGQMPSEVENAIRMVQKCGASPYLAEYSPIPHTELWKDAVSCSRYDLEEEPLTHNNSVIPCLGGKFTWEDVKRLKEIAHAPV